MKQYTAIIILLFPFYLNSQEINIRKQIDSGSVELRTGRSHYKWGKQIVPAALVFLSGMADGLNQKITYQYKDFKKYFPGANDRYWYPQMSFANKYKDGDKAKGERFWGSSGALVFLTDGYHLSRFLDHLFMAGAISIKISLWEKQKWWQYIIQGCGFWAVNRIGFYYMYNVILK